MNWFPLPLFPEGSLASSIVTTVWVGVVVFSFMNLRFGWVFSGLVVPGYLVPLLILKPWAAGVIIVEAIITLWTVQGLSRFLARTGIACEFFGRDRFLALLIVSSFFRIISDVWILPLLGEFFTSQFGLAFDYRNNLQSFGLIVICLAANQLWKTGVIRGAFPFAFSIGITFLIVRFGLMELTNFNITNLNYLYEDIATSVYAAPKAYIILITTAMIASRMNLTYGWDFNGILIPALIALQWYEPLKIVTSFVEALLILFIAVQALKLPCFRSVTVEGSRKFLFFFTISFLYKMAIGWGLFILAPEAKVSDYYGFGYLLPTLMALKMHQHDRVWHQFRITAQVSLVSMFLANFIGLGLTLLPSRESMAGGGGSREAVTAIGTYQELELREELYRSYIASHRSVLEPEGIPAPRPEELQLFESGLKEWHRSLDASEQTWIPALNKLVACGFRIDRFGEQYYRVSPENPATGRPFLVINTKASSDLTVECPDALEERHLFEAALTIFSEQNARVLSVGGSGKSRAGKDFGDYGSIGSWAATIHRNYSRKGGIIEVSPSLYPNENRLYVKRSLPRSLELRELEESFGKYSIHWEDSARDNALRDAIRLASPRGNYCEFQIGHPYRDPIPAGTELPESAEPIDAVIRRACYAFAPRASELYEAPKAEELLHLDRHVLNPLFRLQTDTVATELPAICSAASFYGYRAEAFRRGDEQFVFLWEPNPQRYWGSVLVKVTNPGESANGICFEVPSRASDQSILNFAAIQFRRFGAQALIVAGTNTLTNPDATSQLTVASNRDNFFNLAHQAFCRSWAAGNPTTPLVIQCRAYLPPPDQLYPGGDLIVAPYFGSIPGETIANALEPIRRRLQSEGVEIASLAYDDATSPYAPGFNIQARYLDFASRGTFSLFWISPFLRENYDLQEENEPLQKMLKAVGIPIIEHPLATWLEDHPFNGPGPESRRFKRMISTFREKQDIEILDALSNEPEVSFVSILDPPSSQIFLACLNREGRASLVANLARNAPDRSIEPAPDLLQTFIDTRAAWMEKPETKKHE